MLYPHYEFHLSFSIVNLNLSVQFHFILGIRVRKLDQNCEKEMRYRVILTAWYKPAYKKSGKTVKTYTT